ncbi:RNA methyltransferase [bacterium 1XD8-76]|nr:RNA methyltransferase [bacterium 1XD8-76]
MTGERKNVGKGRELPVAFVEEMRELFGKLPGVSVSELPAFLESLQGERSFGLRRNPLKYTREEFEREMPFSLRGVPWTEEGYFYGGEEQPGKSPYHESGAFYIQEPSAMIAAELLGAEPGECILDLCAAPGGKSTQIAGKMRGRGLLVCNEYVPARAEILGQNMERMGVSNCVILKENAERCAGRFPMFFDRVLVDAPCSGEGMFRKEEQAVSHWSPENVAMCADRQKEILDQAAKMVKPGGVLVYSTCTFSEAEDEAVIRDFLERHRGFYADEEVLSETLLGAGVCPGGVPGTVRMWPHKIPGEGHFAAKLRKRGEKEQSERKSGHAKRQSSGKRNTELEQWNDFRNFCEQYLERGYLLKLEESGRLVWRRERLYLVSGLLPDLGNLRIGRGGLYLGEAKKRRFEPSHTWAMTLKKEDVQQWKEAEDPAVYLRGETLENTGLRGWILVLFQGRPMGWGKAGGNLIKNHYPRGLRIYGEFE